jgi:hypothetical protein
LYQIHIKIAREYNIIISIWGYIRIRTNHPEMMDKALLRQGRIDTVVEMNYPRESAHPSFAPG